MIVKRLERIEVKSRWDVTAYLPGIEVDHAVISITSPGSTFVEIVPGPRCRGVLQLKFDDVAFESSGWRAFTMDQAERVREFLVDTDPLFLVCHCDYGISRSAGMAAALAHIHGIGAERFFTDGRYNPNLLVMQRVLQAYQAPDIEQIIERYRGFVL